MLRQHIVASVHGLLNNSVVPCASRGRGGAELVRTDIKVILMCFGKWREASLSAIGEELTSNGDDYINSVCASAKYLLCCECSVK